MQFVSHLHLISPTRPDCQWLARAARSLPRRGKTLTYGVRETHGRMKITLVIFNSNMSSCLALSINLNAMFTQCVLNLSL